MFLIDERGRIFGKINLFDFCVVIFVIIAIGMGIRVYQAINEPRIMPVPTITMLQSEYDKEKTGYGQIILEWQEKVTYWQIRCTEIEAKRDHFLCEFKGARRYFK